MRKESAKRRERMRRGEKDVTTQSAPSAQPLRCGLALSSQSQPDPHIDFIYLWKRVSGECVIESEEGRGEKVGTGDSGGQEEVTAVVGCVMKKGLEQGFCVYSHRVTARNFRPQKRFTFVIFADPVPCKRLMREMMN